MYYSCWEYKLWGMYKHRESGIDKTYNIFTKEKECKLWEIYNYIESGYGQTVYTFP